MRSARSRVPQATRARRRAMAAGPPLLCVLLLWAAASAAGEATVAVAANFLEPLRHLAAAFADDTGHVLRLSSGSTGQLYAQIVHGAPYDVFLAADRARPEKLERAGRAVAGSRFTYAVGTLVLWSPDAARIGADPRAALTAPRLRHLAIANPELAPYGAAARETLRAMGLWDLLSDRLVTGQNVAQAFQYVATGNAELGFVAFSQVLSPRNAQAGSRWKVPARLHAPIRQDAVLLLPGRANPAARALLEYLRSPAARNIMRRFGYAAPAAAGGRP